MLTNYAARRLALSCLLAMLGLSVPAQSAAEEKAIASAALFDTGGSVTAPAGDAALQMAKWTRVPEDDTKHTFQGDAVLRNDRLAVVLRRGGNGAVVHSCRTKEFPVRAVLAPASERAELKLTATAIVENRPARVIVDADFQSADGKSLGLRYELAKGQPFVKTTPRQGTTALCIAAHCRFVALPDCFADDIVVDAGEVPVAQAELPSENFLLHFLPGGDAIVMSVAAAREQDVEISLSGQGGQRFIDRSKVFYGKEGKIWVAVLDAPDVWREHDVAKADAGKIVPLGWKPPFPAQWRVDWRRADKLTDSWEMIAQTERGNFEKFGWGDEPGTIPASRKRWNTVLGDFSYPCWLDKAGQGYLQPLKRTISFQGPAVIYPIMRVPATPLKEFTVVDLVRETLGVGPCEYILDVEGQGSQYKGRATCNTRDRLAGIYRQNQQKAKRAEVERILREVVVFVKHIRGRIEEYVEFGHGVSAYLDEQEKAHPDLRELTAELRGVARQIDAHVEARKAEIKTPQFVVDLTETFRRTVMDYEGDDALEKCNAITHAIVDVGGNQDELAGECRMVARALRQRAGLILAVDPRAAEMAREIRRRSQQVLRNPAVHESARH